MHSEYFKVDENRVIEIIKMLFLTTKKDQLDEEEIIKESEKHDVTYEHVQEILQSLIHKKIIQHDGHKVYSKGEKYEQ